MAHRGSFLNRALARWPIARANAARDRRDWAKARFHYARALALTPGRADIWVQLGHAEKESGALENAAAAYSRAVVIAPNVADTHLQIGHLRKRQGHLEAAAESYAQAFKLDPTLSGVKAELLALGRTLPKTDAERIAELEVSISSARELAAQDADRLTSLFADVRADFGDLVARVETLAEKASVAAEFAFELSSTRSILGKAFERLASVENDLAAFKDETRALILTVTARPAHEPVKGAAVGAPASNLNVSEENEIAAYS
jgi:tetratricopeptide (TPR) repeat protein